MLTISPSQWRLPVSKLRSLIGKLRSMHLAVPGAIGHFFFIQKALTKAGSASEAYLSKVFHREISDWQRLITDLLARPRFLAEVVRCLLTALGFCNASSVGAGGVWIDPDGTGKNFVWRLPWPEDIVADLVTWENPTGGITNSDLELVALLLQESSFPLACSRDAWHAPLTGSGNTPAVSWCFRESSTLNLVMADLLCVRSEMNSRALLTPPFFYHPGTLNTMVDDASRRFDLSGNNLISFFRSKYRPSHSVGLWTLCHPPTKITSCVISVLRRKMSGLAIFPTTAPPSSMTSSKNYVPQCRSSIGSMILPSQSQISLKCMVTRSVTDTGLSSLKSEQNRCGVASYCHDPTIGWTPRSQKTSWLLLLRP